MPVTGKSADGDTCHGGIDIAPPQGRIRPFTRTPETGMTIFDMQDRNYYPGPPDRCTAASCNF